MGPNASGSKLAGSTMLLALSSCAASTWTGETLTLLGEYGMRNNKLGLAAIIAAWGLYYYCMLKISTAL